MTFAILQAAAVSTLALTMAAASCGQRDSTYYRQQAFLRRLESGFSGLQAAGETTPVLFSSHRGRAVRSEDGGQTWTALAPARPGDPLTSVEVEPLPPQALFAWARQVRMISLDGGRSWSPASRWPGTRDRVVYHVEGDDVRRTDDHGVTWHRIDVTLPAKLVTSLHARPGDPNQVLATSAFGGYRSRDGGATWTRLSVTTGFGHVGFVRPFETPGRLLATAAVVIGGGSLLYESSDDGGTWTTVDFGADHHAVIDGLVALTSPTVLFVTPSAKRPGDPGVLFRSLDGGRTWQRTTGARGALSGLVRWPGSPDTLIAAFADGGIQRSDDGGATWRPVRRQ